MILNKTDARSISATRSKTLDAGKPSQRQRWWKSVIISFGIASTVCTTIMRKTCNYFKNFKKRFVTIIELTVALAPITLARQNIKPIHVTV